MFSGLKIIGSYMSLTFSKHSGFVPCPSNLFFIMSANFPFQIITLIINGKGMWSFVRGIKVQHVYKPLLNKVDFIYGFIPCYPIIVQRSQIFGNAASKGIEKSQKSYLCDVENKRFLENSWHLRGYNNDGWAFCAEKL